MNIDIVGSDNKRPRIFIKYLLRNLTAGSLVLAFLIAVAVANCPAQARPKAPSQSVYSDGLKKWTVQDSVRVRYILTRKELEADDSRAHGYGSDAIVPSPGGKYFFFVSRHGELGCDCDVYELSVFAVSEVAPALASGAARAPAPLRTVTMRHQNQAIRQPDWVDGDAGIEFRGRQNVDSPEQLYRLEIGSGRLEALTQLSEKQQLASYARQGDTRIYNASELVMEDVPGQYPVYALTPGRVRELVQDKGARRRYITQTYVSTAGRPAWQMKSGYGGGGVSFSPDGRRVLAVRIPEQVPEGWARYDGVAEKLKLQARTRVEPQDFSQFMWVDLENQRETPVFDAPTGRATRVGAQGLSHALWSADGRRVVLVNAALPLPPQGPAGEHADMAYIISYEVDTGRWEVLEPMQHASGMRVILVGWRKPGQELLVMHLQDGKIVPGTTYTLRQSRWISQSVDPSVQPAPPQQQARPAGAALAQEVTVTLRQSANDPPVVVASRGRRELALTGPDPALQGVWIARMEPFQWKDGEGTQRTGGLLLPREMPKDGSRIPLVIQPTPYLPGEFRPDGAARTGFAAQALVAQGMAVLNIDLPGDLPQVYARGPAAGASMFIDWVETATEAAAQAHPIDLQRVGLLGWSHTGFLAYHTVTNPRQLRLGAAISHDGNAGSYFHTLIYAALGDETIPAANRYLYDGSFYEAKASWLERETSFNVDRVQAPMLFVIHGENVTYDLDTIGAFQIARKPAEFLVLSGAAHDLKAPRHREASLEATVDWMTFWLQGREDARPEKAERYARWRLQRELHAKNLKKTANDPKPTSDGRQPR